MSFFVLFYYHNLDLRWSTASPIGNESQKLKGPSIWSSVYNVGHGARALNRCEVKLRKVVTPYLRQHLLRQDLRLPFLAIRSISPSSADWVASNPPHLCFAPSQGLTTLSGLKWGSSPGLRKCDDPFIFILALVSQATWGQVVLRAVCGFHKCRLIIISPWSYFCLYDQPTCLHYFWLGRWALKRPGFESWLQWNSFCLWIRVSAMLKTKLSSCWSWVVLHNLSCDQIEHHLPLDFRGKSGAMSFHQLATFSRVAIFWLSLQNQSWSYFWRTLSLT